jgi:uncharacterized protein (TIGR04255 family)
VRSLPPLRLLRSPLLLVLAQVRISPVLQMGEFVPRIQESLRHQGFPRFRVKRTQEIVIAPKPIFGAHERWLFSNKERTQTVVLAPDFVVLVASVYSVFEEFADILKKVLAIVGETTQVALSDRLGLRYVDVLRLSKGESYRDYLQPGLHGLDAATLGASSVLQQSQVKAETAMGTLVVRLWQSQDGRFLPPDLEGEDVAFQIQPEPGEMLTILDIDHFSVKEREFNPELLVQDLWGLHDGADRAFRLGVVTPEALTRWGAEQR